MIDVKIEDAIATVTMRHGKANALDITLCEALADCFDKLCTSDARAAVLTGQGHIFSAGVDLLQVSAGGADYIRRFLPMLHRMYENCLASRHTHSENVESAYDRCEDRGRDRH